MDVPWSWTHTELSQNFAVCISCIERRRVPISYLPELQGNEEDLIDQHPNRRLLTRFLTILFD